MTDRIQNRRGTASQWTSVNPTLLSGELGVETDTGKLKVGDGSTAWASRNYAGGSTNASDLVSGTLNDARLSANVPLKNAATEFSNTLTFAGIEWKEDNATPAYNDYWRGWLSSFDVNTPSSSNLDTVMRWGFNVASGGGRINASDASFADSVESEFWTNGVNVMERHWEGFTKQGTSFRIISALIPKNDSDASVSGITFQSNNYVFQDWSKTQRISYNFNNATTSAIVHSTKANYQFPTQNGYLYSQMNQANNAFVHGPFLNSFNRWQWTVAQVYSNTDATYDPGTALVAIRRNGNGSANEISLDVSMENANSSNLWISQKWSGVCHGGLEPLIENFSDQSTGLASLKIKTADGGGDARIVWQTISNTVAGGIDRSANAFVISKSSSLGTSNLLSIDLTTDALKIKGNVGFNDTAPIAKPTVTGSRSGNAALASLLTALADYGLITDSTS